MRRTKQPVQWYHAFFPNEAVAEHHRECQESRGRIAKKRRNGAGWEVMWREKQRRPRQVH